MPYEQPSRSELDRLNSQTTQTLLGETVHWILRVGAAGCFVGHGAFGIITKSDWLRYFAFAGIGHDGAYRLMPLIGSIDILTGLLILIYPARILLMWATVWTLWTALLRPLTGEGPWEFLERAGNFGVPFALLWLAGGSGKPGRWIYLARPLFDSRTIPGVAWVLRLTVASLLIGHGGFGAFMHKHSWTHYLSSLGISLNDASGSSVLPAIGWFEIALGILVVVWPSAELLVFVVIWKVFTEMLRPVSGEPLWEFIERFGSYSAPFAFFLVLVAQRKIRRGFESAKLVSGG